MQVFVRTFGLFQPARVCTRFGISSRSRSVVRILDTEDARAANRAEATGRRGSRAPAHNMEANWSVRNTLSLFQ